MPHPKTVTIEGCLIPADQVARIAKVSPYYRWIGGHTTQITYRNGDRIYLKMPVDQARSIIDAARTS
jgi:hypothetical protein